MRNHKFRPLVKTGFVYCENCGLLNLKNWISVLCVKLGCDYKENAQFKAWQKNPKGYPIWP